MRAFHWTIAALAAVLGFVGISLWLNRDGSQLGWPILIVSNNVSTTLHRGPETSNFRVRDRVFHKQFGHGTVVATDGRRLTIDFDNGGVKRVFEPFVVRSDDPHPAN
jgi:hypothetical protein